MNENKDIAFKRLSPPIRKFVYDKGWTALHSIQEAAIKCILDSNDNFILASRTASGKTEAAFFPILSKADFDAQGVQLLYISPLIALINDQFYRIEELCTYMEVTVTRWHGEANKTLKNRLIKQPSGIVLITPESLEAMFVNKPFNVRHLFGNVQYVVIDEIHSFVGTDRGIQLQSILSRLRQVHQRSFSIVGLSATMSDARSFVEVKEFMGDIEKSHVISDKTAKDVQVIFRFFKNENAELPPALLKDLYLETKDHKVLVFPNSRGRAEEVAVRLKKESERAKGHAYYFSHHSSVDKSQREYVEHFAKTNERHNFCIACTSTLELGIDLGTLDRVVQIDATYSIASLIQRVGRSGRRKGERSKLFLYATNKWSLLQSVACWMLHQENFIEPPNVSEKPYDILLHQALSIVKGHAGIALSALKSVLKENTAFQRIELAEIDEILQHLIAIELLEKLQQEVIIGIEGEKIVNSRDFYSVFKAEENFKVVHAGKAIGAIPVSPQTIEDENILLAARIWKIKFVDYKAKKIDVVPANDGKKPMFFGGGAVVHHRVREKMWEILYATTKYDFFDTPSREELSEMRSEFAAFPIKQIASERPLRVEARHVLLFTFAGTKINRTLQLLFGVAAIKNTFDDAESAFNLDVSKEELMAKWQNLSAPLSDIEPHIALLLQKNPALLGFSKWGAYLPETYKIKLLKNQYFDIEGTARFLSTLKLISNP